MSSGDSVSSADVSVLSEEPDWNNTTITNGRSSLKKQSKPAVEDDDGSLSDDGSFGESFDGGSNYGDDDQEEGGGGRARRRGSTDSFGGESREDLGQAADDLIELVENYLRDFDGPINENDEELIEIREALKEAQESLEKCRAAALLAEQERLAEIEGAKQTVRRIQRVNIERQGSIEESSITSKEADEKRSSIVDADLQELDRSGHEREEMNLVFKKQKERVLRKSKKRDSLATDMKLGAKKAMRRLKMVDVRARIAKEDAEKAAREAAKNRMDMSEAARRERVHGYYMRFAMPKRTALEVQIKKLPASSGTTVEDVALLPWDEKGMRVNVGKLNKVMMGLAKPDW